MLAFRDHLILMARYNQWMNAKCIDLLRDVPDADLLTDRGAFFGSVLGTLNHILVADLTWLNRMAAFQSEDQRRVLADLPVPTGLSQIPFPTLAGYAEARRRLDDLLSGFIDTVDEAALSAPFTYYNIKGEPQSKTLGLVLCHVFNHQTHHRGQVTTLLSQMGLDIGVTDLHSLVS